MTVVCRSLMAQGKEVRAYTACMVAELTGREFTRLGSHCHSPRCGVTWDLQDTLTPISLTSTNTGGKLKLNPRT